VNGDVKLTAAGVPYTPIDPKHEDNVQLMIDTNTRDSLTIRDMTPENASVSLGRNNGWVVAFFADPNDRTTVLRIGDATNFVNPLRSYRRFLYTSTELALADDESTAYLLWTINDDGTPESTEPGSIVSFHYLDGTTGLVLSTTILNPNNQVAIDEFRPNDNFSLWEADSPSLYFGQNRSDPFPTDDIVRSIIDINVPTLNTWVGDVNDLTTVHKTVVEAINELKTSGGGVISEARDNETNEVIFENVIEWTGSKADYLLSSPDNNTITFVSERLV
jgi:hypothetical protein